MQTILDKIWLEEIGGEKALRADFRNDRHHRVVIQRPYGNEQLAEALIDLALNIRRDPHLTTNAIGQRGAACGTSAAPTGCASNGDTEDE